MAKVKVYRYKGWDNLCWKELSPEAYATKNYIENSKLVKIEESGIEIDEELLDRNGHVTIERLAK